MRGTSSKILTWEVATKLRHNFRGMAQHPPVYDGWCHPWLSTHFSSLSILPPFPQFLGLEDASGRTFYFWYEHLGPDALPGVTNGLRWASNPGPSESSALPLGHGCSEYTLFI